MSLGDNETKVNMNSWWKIGIWKSIVYGITGVYFIFLILILFLFLYGGYYMLLTGRYVSPYDDAYTLHNQLWEYVYDNGFFPKDEETLRKAISDLLLNKGSNYPMSDELLLNKRSNYPKRKRWHYRLLSENDNDIRYLIVVDSSKELFKVLTYYGAEVVIIGRAKRTGNKWDEEVELFCRGEGTKREFSHLQKP